MAEKLTYEEAVTKLEDIVKELEQGEVTLEKSISLFTEGMNLLKICNKYLDEAEDQIKVVLDGKIQEYNRTQGD